MRPRDRRPPPSELRIRRHARGAPEVRLVRVRVRVRVGVRVRVSVRVRVRV